MGRKTVDTLANFTKELTKLTMPAGADVAKINKDIKKLFDNAAVKNMKVFVELHSDDRTKELTEIKSRIGTSVPFITQWP